MMDDFFKLLEMESFEIDHRFKIASIEGRGTSQEVAERRESAVRKFLEKYYPTPYRITKGNIIDSYDNRSASIDCIILNPSHPHTVSYEEKYSVIFADGVDVAIEVKPNLANINAIKKALVQIKSVKMLTRQRDGNIPNFHEPNLTELALLNFKKIPSIIFGNKTYKGITKLVDVLINYYVENQIPRSLQFDFIVINGLGILFNSKRDSYCFINNMDEGLYFHFFHHQTLAYFLQILSSLPQSEPRMSPPVIKPYLKFHRLDLLNFTNKCEQLLQIAEPNNPQ